MNELLPYESTLSQHWIDLPLPDENRAWADMKRRLDGEEKRRVLPFWWSGCAGWGLLAIVLLGLGWWIIRPEKWFNKTSDAQQTIPVFEKNDKEKNDTLLKQPGGDSIDVPDTTTTILDDSKNESNTIRSVVIPGDDLPADKKAKTITIEKKTTVRSGQGTIIKNKQQPIDLKKEKSTLARTEIKNDKPLPEDKKTGDQKVEDATAVPLQPTELPIATVITTQPVVVVDSDARKNQNDSAATKTDVDPVISDTKSKKDSTKKNPMVYSAGLGMHQVVPVAGQKWVPYSSSGREASLADYIPSVYFRATKPGKWFLQSEFRYGAPQHNKELDFRQTIRNDSIQGVIYKTTTTSTLKKTYYHQLPISFSYYVLPNWSIGAGMQWNSFYAAVAETNVIQRNPFTQTDTVLSKFIQAINNDSASEFKKTYWQALLQTQYQWKRFTFGARYNFGIQPFIKFTLPGQNPREEKNNSLQVYLLFELWKSKKK